MKLRPKKDTLKSTGLYKKLIAEILFNLIICPPNFDGVIQTKQLGGDMILSYDAICFSLSLCRSYLLLRLYQQYSRWTNQQAILACVENGCKNDIKFLAKAELTKRPYFMVFMFFVVTTLILGIAIKTYEV